MGIYVKVTLYCNGRRIPHDYNGCYEPCKYGSQVEAEAELRPNGRVAPSAPEGWSSDMRAHGRGRECVEEYTVECPKCAADERAEYKRLYGSDRSF